MSEQTPQSNTGTAKSPTSSAQPGHGRYELNLHVLVLRLRDLQKQFLWLADPLSPEWLTPEELAVLRYLYDSAVLLDESATKLEERWRARQGLSPKI